jgi:hypothetical protein
MTAAEAFMKAAAAKDTKVLAEATALRAETEAKLLPTRQMLKSLREENASAEDLDALSRAFDGMQIVGEAPSKSSMTRVISLARQDDNMLIKRSLYVRKEKAGWKVVDISDPRSERTGIRGFGGPGGPGGGAGGSPVGGASGGAPRGSGSPRGPGNSGGSGGNAPG